MEIMLMSVSLSLIALIALMVLPMIPDSRQYVRVLDRETMERLRYSQYRNDRDR